MYILKPYEGKSSSQLLGAYLKYNSKCNLIHKKSRDEVCNKLRFFQKDI